MQQQPAPSPAAAPAPAAAAAAAPKNVAKQPKPKADMVIKGNRNVRNIPVQANGTRDWSDGICDCCGHTGNGGTCECSMPILSAPLLMIEFRLPRDILPMHCLWAEQSPPRASLRSRFARPIRWRIFVLERLFHTWVLDHCLPLRLGFTGEFYPIPFSFCSFCHSFPGIDFWPRFRPQPIQDRG